MAFMMTSLTTDQILLTHFLTAHALKDFLPKNLTDFVGLSIMGRGVMN